MHYGFGHEPHFSYGPHYGYEQNEDHWTGDLSDVTPFGVLVPPLGLAQAFGGHGGGSAPSRPRPRSGIPWSTIALFGILAGGALAVYTIYKATKASEPISRKAGEGVARLLAARYGAGAVPERGIPFARRTILPPEPRPKLLQAAPPRTRAVHTIRELPEYEAYR